MFLSARHARQAIMLPCWLSRVSLLLIPSHARGYCHINFACPLRFAAPWYLDNDFFVNSKSRWRVSSLQHLSTSLQSNPFVLWWICTHGRQPGARLQLQPRCGQYKELHGILISAKSNCTGARPILCWRQTVVFDGATGVQSHPMNAKVQLRVNAAELKEETCLSNEAMQHILNICGERYAWTWFIVFAIIYFLL